MKQFITAAILAFLSISVSAKELSGKAPDFSTKTLTGETVKLSDYKGKVVMINFWASWCAPCRQEMPLLEEISKEMEKAGFVLLGLNIDEEVSDAKDFLKTSPVTFPILLDPEGKVAELYQVQTMPSSFFIDRKGNLSHLHSGYKPGEEDDYRKVIKKLLAQ